MNSSSTFTTNNTPVFRCTDYLVTQESFELFLEEDYQMLITKPFPKDLSKYYESDQYISHTDGKKSLFDFAYQLVKKYSLQRKLNLLNSFRVSEKRVLDIGAGTGDFLKVCQNNGWKVTGIEPSEKARELSSQKGVDLCPELADVESKRFEVITLWHVLEHVENLEDFIKQLKNLLTPEGVLVVAVPNFKSYDANYYKSEWAAFDVPRHLWHFSQFSIKKLFSKENIRLERTVPMKFDSYYVSMLSEKHKYGKLNLWNALRVGFRSNWKARRSGEYSSLIYILKN